MTKTPRDAATSSTSAGFGLVEILISMFLLTLLSIAFLPLLVDGLKNTARNASIATATQIASGQLDEAGRLPRTCAALAGFTSAVIPTVTDSRGTVFTPRRESGACPTSGYPATVSVRVWVTASSDPALLVESRTTVIIERAS